MKISSAHVGLLALISIGLGIAGCFDTPDPTKLQCHTKGGCPSDYYCSNGKCLKGSGAGGSAYDASIGGNGGAAGEGGRIDASAGTDGQAGASGKIDSSTIDGRGGIDAPADAPSDFPTGVPVGSTCQVNGDCTLGHCIDGVCCESACDGCNACSNAYTGKDDGKCASASTGQDPHKACNDETASNLCGNDGTCDGLGACRKAGAGRSCGKASCGDGKTFTPAPTCDGLGMCVTGKSKTCDPYPCADTGCLVTCDPTATTSNCDKGSYCDATSKVCVTQKADGQPAKNPSECSSGIIADGVCCHEACAGCKACTAALNGQADTTTGQCLPVKAGIDDPHKTCTAGPICGIDGKCDGAGACRYTASGTSCAADACSGSTLTKSSCDGTAHTCAAVTSVCPNGLICGSTSACKTSCTANSDCVSGFCSSGTCKTKVADGGACAADGDCQNAHCLSGICCATTCGVCNSCATGTCKAADNGKTCDPGKFCNAGTCGACADGSSCNPDGNLCQTGTISCSTGSAVCQTPTNVAAGKSCGSSKVCDGSGNCVACTTGTACDSTNLCQTQTTAISCTTGTNQCFSTGSKPAGTTCGAGKVCDGSGTCSTCMSGTACDNGNACQAQTTAISCTTGANQCFANGNKAAGTNCGSGKTCDSTGSCVACMTGTVCDSTNLCQVQTTAVSCTNGTSQCFAGGAKPAGTSCGSGKVCNGNSTGGCVSCSSGTGCTSNTCEAQTTAVSCSTGASQCFATGNKAPGSSCGSNLYCNAGGVCNCAGGSCTPSNACQTGSISCSSGSPVCAASGSQPSGTSCGASGSGQTCDGSGTCGCALGMVACNRCQGWNFESGSASGWSVDTGTIQVATGAGKGSYSLAIANVNIDQNATSRVTVQVSMCAAGTSATVPTNGFKVSVDFKFQSPYGLAFGDDGSGSGSVGILTGTDGSNGWTLDNGGPVMTSGTWYHFGPYTIPPYGTTTATFLAFAFIPQYPWSGTIFVDNVSLTQ